MKTNVIASLGDVIILGQSGGNGIRKKEREKNIYTYLRVFTKD